MPPNSRFVIALALAAGFLGGLASRSLGPAPVHAQASRAPAEISAQKFVLVDATGAARAVFGIEAQGSPVIEVRDAQNRVLTLLLTSRGLYWPIRRLKRPALLPAQP